MNTASKPGNFGMAEMTTLMATNCRRKPCEFILRPDAAATIPKETDPKGTETLFGLKFYVKEGQRTPCWMISDPEIARAYLADEITELDLMQILARSSGYPTMRRLEAT